jgi:hypothetical protein
MPKSVQNYAAPICGAILGAFTPAYCVLGKKKHQVKRGLNA